MGESEVPGGAEAVPSFERYVDDAGRVFEYAVVRHPGARGLGVHFSAFFFGDAAKYRAYADFRGYFHRLKMLGSDQALDWLFLCDTYGVTGDGSYYAGQGGDPFVERAVIAITELVLEQTGHTPKQTVCLGSSMGATGAVVVGIRLSTVGVIAIAPHVDLEFAATMCGRYDEVAYACADGDPTSEASRSITKRVEALLDKSGPGDDLPHLFVQACADDVGVYDEQVLPLAERWREHGGRVELDIRAEGGHSSDFATRAVLLDAAHRLLDGRDVEPERYRTEPMFEGRPVRPPLVLRLRRRLSPLKQRYTRLRS